MQCKKFDNLFRHGFYFDCIRVRDGEPIPCIIRRPFSSFFLVSQLKKPPFRRLFVLFFFKRILNLPKQLKKRFLLVLRQNGDELFVKVVKLAANIALNFYSLFRQHELFQSRVAIDALPANKPFPLKPCYDL